MTKAIFPGSFDPFTVGHESIVRRGLEIFDEIVIAVGINSDKHGYFSIDQRVMFIKALFNNEVQVLTYNGLTVDFARKIGATHILRGLRTAADFEFERAIAQINKKLSGIDTTFLLTTPEHTPISSSIVRDILHHDGDVSEFVPTPIYNLMKTLKSNETNI